MERTFDPWWYGHVSLDVAWAARAAPEALQSRREQRLRALLAAARRSPLYQRRQHRHGLEPTRLSDFAPVHKADLMSHFAEWVVDPEIRLDDVRRFVAEPANIGQAYLGRYVVWESSGSSGEPGLFVQDASAMAVYDALDVLRRPSSQPMQRALDPWYLAERIAFVGATGGHFASTVSIARLRRLNPVLRESLREVSFLQPLAQIDAEVQAVDPTIIGTYPSAAVLLAQERSAGRLRARPREIWTGGESLSPAMRRCIAQSFGCPVVDSYGASEFFTIASECRCGHLHLNSDWVILEPVDARGRPVAPDEPSDTVWLTNLANHVQPLIRYDLGDRILVRSQPCPCGSTLPVIEVQGRCDDTLWFDGSDGRRVPVLPLALTTVLETEAELFDFQLEQTGPSALQLRTSMHGAPAQQGLRKGHQALSRFLARQGAPGVDIGVRAGCTYRPGRSGKVARVLAQRQTHRRLDGTIG